MNLHEKRLIIICNGLFLSYICISKHSSFSFSETFHLPFLFSFLLHISSLIISPLFISHLKIAIYCQINATVMNRWPELIPTLLAHIGTPDVLKMYNALLAMRKLVKRYEYKPKWVYFRYLKPFFVILWCLFLTYGMIILNVSKMLFYMHRNYLS